ncbi:MAG TPA: hypothetical protein VFZ27_01050 [Terriglobia bacterium]|nr:hypothetical protein [Terriglobia bacterium]
MPISLHVECYSGYKADQRPLRFHFRENDSRTVEVVEVLDQWYGVGYRCFKVLADDRNTYILRHNEKADEWVLDSFRRTNP